MWFLYALSWLSTLVQVLFLTLAIAAGLYYMAELVEENTVVTAKIIRWITIFTLVIHVGLFLFEDFPTSMIVCGAFSQCIHLLLLGSFPFFELASPQFILGVVMVVVNHYLAFQYFGEHYYSFSEVMAYFTLCVWLVPFFFFVSLSANENVLPTTTTSAGMGERRPLLSDENDVVSNYFLRREKKYGLLAVFNSLRESIVPGSSRGGKKAF